MDLCYKIQMEVQLQPLTEQTIYGLHVEKVYEVHIRCRMKAFTKFGDFSESVFIQVPRSPNKGKLVPQILVHL